MAHPRQGSLGRLPHKPDVRDFHISQIPYYGPARGVTRMFYTMAGHDFRIDQGQEGTCEGHSWTNFFLAGPVTHPTFPSFDNPQDAHLFARKLYLDATGDTTFQQGAYTRQILKVVLARGEIGAYYQCPSVDEITNALATVGPVCFASNWYESMFEPVSKYGNSYLHVDTSSGIAGGHAYCLTGMNLAPAEGPPYVRMENSWGAGWGHDGTARIAIADLRVLFDGDAYHATEEAF